MATKFSKSDIEFIQKLPVCRVATATKKCEPWVRPVWGVFDGENVYFATDDGSPKLKHIKENPKVSVVFDDYDREDWGNARGIRFQGEASILWKGEEYRHAHTLLKEKFPAYRTKEGGWEEGETPIVKVKPEITERWAFGKWGT
jgi:nitroimidazol reductase NimA-like FMN-containing flavoprotein (pyridoxamine 5'-phosphate oxidase superfamily)